MIERIDIIIIIDVINIEIEMIDHHAKTNNYKFHTTLNHIIKRSY